MNLKENNSRLFQISLTILAVSTLLYFIFLAFCMRPANDDLGLLELLQEHGFSGSLNYAFRNFDFRHLTLILFNITYSAADPVTVSKFVIPLVHVCWLVLLLSSLNGILGFLLKEVFGLQLPAKESIFLSLVFLLSIYFFTFQSVEIFTYYTQMNNYFYPMISCVAGINLLFSERKSLIKTILTSILFMHASSGAENFSAGLILLFSGALILAYLEKSSFLQKRKGLLSVILISVLVSAFLVYFSPGTGQRSQIEAKMRELMGVKGENVFLNFFVQMKEVFFQRKFFFILTILVFWFIAGIFYSGKLRMDEIKIRRVRHFLALISAIFFVVTFAASLQFFEGRIPVRSWFPFNFALSAYLCMIVFIAGCRQKQKTPGFISILPAVGLTVVLGIKFQKILIYTVAYDDRVEMIKVLDREDILIKVDPLPDGGPLTSSELSIDPNEIGNVIFMKVHRLKGRVALRSANDN
jgi:hypothetical protein